MNELQIVIECFIRENGGCVKLADTIEAEWCKQLYRPPVYMWQTKEITYLLNNYNTHTVAQIANVLGRTYNATQKKIAQLREKAIIDYRKYKIVS